MGHTDREYELEDKYYQVMMEIQQFLLSVSLKENENGVKWLNALRERFLAYNVMEELKHPKWNDPAYTEKKPTTIKVVINKCYGGFGVSHKALKRMLELGYKGKYDDDGFVYLFDIDRSDPALVQAVEELDKESWGRFAQLEVVEVPVGVKYYISDYDGIEAIHEDHNVWG